MALISQSEVEARLGRSLTAEEATSFSIINPALQAQVEKIIGSGVENADAHTRYYDGGVQHLAVDPCTTVTAVKLVDDDQVVTDTLDTTDYTLEPINNTLKTMIRHRSGKFWTGINNIGVTAIFSIYNDTKVLAIVKESLINALVSEITNNGNILKESIEGYSVEYASSTTQAHLNSIKYLFPGV